MLSCKDNGLPRTGAGAIEARVLELVVETASFERGEILPGTPLAAVLDSLTLAAVIARVEATFGIALKGDETLALLMARDVGELCRLVARTVERSGANLGEITGNASC